ncbi:carboxy terminal-processing peptidase [Aequorivita vladivostokensis]|jgi:carboxyl-terminal processing protease|uniref:Peptidase S41 n=1 Tax=Aequorivita vladivostokensis TaxID=171194 RepID=A0ABR5DI48_9FLAO|nr:carboxy terminal-processing peptidase [Aequorivita vladivostokensis]KJJ38414.1 peptidase S41 [Aequorivita vladivostokensis]MDX1782671.1 carboxy terminal-processing peptidase [Aequorivita vladivostokensis]|tara:strand:- start:219920 stop:222130 length:2211 start_codon:yes stop_codon:yes gene_type:complete
MKKNFKVLFLAVFVSVASCSFTTKEFNDPDKDKLLLDLITYVLQKGHYDPKDINDEFSAGVYKDFINGLDPLKRYFLASDIEEFSKYKTEIDDQIKNKDLTFFDLVYGRFIERMEDVKKIYPEVLDKPFDFTENETINVDYDNLAYATSRKELKERWKQQLKFTTLSSYYDLVEEQNKKEKGVTTSKSDDYEGDDEDGEVENKTSKESADEPFEPKSLAELESKARETAKSSLDEYFEFTKDLQRKDYFAIYLNTIVEEFDPHTNYFAPPDKDRFDLRMSGKLEGIGARLQKKNDYITVIEIISGGPAWRSEKIEVGDAILKVKQEDEKDAVSIVGMRIDDAVKLIKGPKGTKVTLTIKNVDGTISDKVITRDVVELEETYAKSSLIDKGDRKFGLINLPQFYFDMENYKERNAATDVKKEILRLKEEGMEGLVLDLRDNGGGSLRTAVDIAGLFIKKGPIVQVASAGNKEVLEDKDSEIVWDGPLVILVNELSASASEILAAAMQDYKRAIILGSKQTYGKGTVQNVIDLNQWLRKNDLGDLGALKITSQKFYRVNGGSTQLEGVKSDVVMPDRYSYIDVGERDYDNPLPYDKIDAAKYDVWDGYIDYDETIEKSKARMAQNEQLKLIDDNARWIKERRDEKVVNLNFDKYSAEIEQRKKETERFDAIDEYDNHLTFESLPYETALMKQDTTLSEKRKRWHKNLSKDMYVEEAVHVLEDLKLNNIKAKKVADIKN